MAVKLEEETLWSALIQKGFKEEMERELLYERSVDLVGL